MRGAGWAAGGAGKGPRLAAAAGFAPSDPRPVALSPCRRCRQSALRQPFQASQIPAQVPPDPRPGPPRSPLGLPRSISSTPHPCPGPPASQVPARPPQHHRSPPRSPQIPARPRDKASGCGDPRSSAAPAARREASAETAPQIRGGDPLRPRAELLPQCPRRVIVPGALGPGAAGDGVSAPRLPDSPGRPCPGPRGGAPAREQRPPCPGVAGPRGPPPRRCAAWSPTPGRGRRNPAPRRRTATRTCAMAVSPSLSTAGGLPVDEATWERMWKHVAKIHPDGERVALRIRGATDLPKGHGGLRKDLRALDQARDLTLRSQLARAGHQGWVASYVWLPRYQHGLVMAKAVSSSSPVPRDGAVCPRGCWEAPSPESLWKCRVGFYLILF
ncbi:basic proline-rich protein-like [Erinaceus europaeus]|uniref:Basic proline-rich protein-like n=1 Tax=Erinaceus europaeus TaxID=9365 RepID=A0ABM3WLB1_ERIEU|nr:basic proline-rich protein-like [Erinaceus europaeus]